MSKTIRNVDGQLITQTGRLDQRQFNRPVQVNDGFATHVFDVVERPSDGLPWHVIETQLSDGARRRVSRHSKRDTAMKRAEIERLAQPNRKSNRKIRHKLGVDRATD